MEDTEYIVEEFVLSIFVRVEKEERTCDEITKTQAMDFNRTSHFIELLTMFHELTEEWLERCKYFLITTTEKYCKWKAANIMKCLKEGKVPERGNPFSKDGDEEVKGGGEGTDEFSAGPSANSIPPPLVSQPGGPNMGEPSSNPYGNVGAPASQPQVPQFNPAPQQPPSYQPPPPVQP